MNFYFVKCTVKKISLSFSLKLFNKNITIFLKKETTIYLLRIDNLMHLINSFSFFKNK